MAKASVSGAWERAIAFARAEWRLLAPVSLFFLGVPSVLMQLGMGPEALARFQATGQAPASGWLLFPAVLLGMAGGLAISALALQRHLTVGEALRRAGQRLPMLVGAVMIVAAGVLGAVVVLTMLMALIVPASDVAGTARLLMAATLPMLALFVLIFSLATPMAVSEKIGPLAAVKRVWRLSSGSRIKVIGVWLIFFLFSGVLNLAATLIVGTLGRLTGSAELGRLAELLVSGAVASAVSTVSLLWFAEFYRALVSAPTVPRSGI